MTKKKNGPGAAATANGAARMNSSTDFGSPCDDSKPSGGEKTTPASVEVRFWKDGRHRIVRGREAQTLYQLMIRGAVGANSGELSRFRWARRTSAYVLRLRRMGFSIATVRERVGDATVGRYVLYQDFDTLAAEGLPNV